MVISGSIIFSIQDLGDYALETGLSFNLKSAAIAVANCAVSTGVSKAATDMLIKRMVIFYHNEDAIRTGCISSDVMRNVRLRYKFKSADICLIQRMAIADGPKRKSQEYEALYSASAALDIVDDVMDLVEDTQQKNGNPFVAGWHDSKRLKAAFEWCISPFLYKMRNSMHLNEITNMTSEYLMSTIERIDNCHRTIGYIFL